MTDNTEPTIDTLKANILTEFKQVLKLAPADYTENCTNVVMSLVDEYVADEEKPKGIVIYKTDGSVLFESSKDTLREAVLEKYSIDANLCDANLRGADLCDANLLGAELASAKFYGKGGEQKLNRSQLPDFLAALGFVIEED